MTRRVRLYLATDFDSVRYLVSGVGLDRLNPNGQYAIVTFRNEMRGVT